APVRQRHCRCVRVQLDVYGEVDDAMLQARKGGLPPHHRERELAADILPFLEKIWVEPDEGIWEVRGPRQHFHYSKVMAR
ncbi:glycoside hydrolase family 15 protein, partial [Rhizobium ruizarguesonis]